jgi:hypothetical protein
MMALELLGVGVASRHHGGVLGDAQVGLAQPHAASAKTSIMLETPILDVVTVLVVAAVLWSIFR